MTECAECGTEFRRVIGSHSDYCSVFCRFIAKVAITDPAECWEWTAGKRSHKGYGGFNGKHYAHRFAYELAVGPIPDGLTLDHLCRNRLCVNPDHLEPVTARENTLRGESPNVVTARTGVCKRGHSMDDAYIERDGSRQCRHCHNLRQRSYRARLTNTT